jgi:NADH dehydrogenase FAD-containing subunit
MFTLIPLTYHAADAAGWVEVNPATTQHVKFKNIFSLGDCSSMPNSKTAAAITAQAPVLVHNLLAEMDGKQLNAVYGQSALLCDCVSH